MPSFLNSLQEAKKEILANLFEIEEKIDQLKDLELIVQLCTEQFEKFSNYSPEFRQFELLFTLVEMRLSFEVKELSMIVRKCRENINIL